MTRFPRVVLYALVLALTSYAVPAFAQSQAITGTIEGIVRDESGGPLPGVSVALQNTATNFEKTVITDSDGRYRGVLLPLGPYRVTAALAGFGTLVREGIDVALGQSVNLPLHLKLSAVSERVVVTSENPVVETTRVEGSTRIDKDAVKSLPNNGRNFLDFAKLTPSVAIVQGPDGDELTINGQKGIQNNVSVDGADFNNPFFGEQRGGQRPAFTFNLDAVQEVVVVADGANAEFGRSSSGFVNVVTKSGRTTSTGRVTATTRTRAFRRRPSERTAPRREVRPEPAPGGVHAGRPPGEGQPLLLRLVRRPARAIDQADRPEPDREARRRLLRRARQPERERVHRADERRLAVLAKIDWSPRHSTRSRCAARTRTPTRTTARSTSTPGAAARTPTSWTAPAPSRVGALQLLGCLPQRVPLPARARGSAAPVHGPNITGQNRPLPDTAFDFGRQYRFGEPFFIPVDYYDTRIQLNDNVSILKGAHELKAGFEFNRVNASQIFRGFANGRYIFRLDRRFFNYARNPRFVECSDGSTSETGTCPTGTSITGPRPPLPPAGGRGQHHRRAGRHAGHSPGRTGGLHPGQVVSRRRT
jgi:hypothetical protein